MVPPDEFRGPNQEVLAHGIGLSNEWPVVYTGYGDLKIGFSGVFEPGMVFCVEALVGKKGYGESVKLENMVLINETGYEVLSDYEFEKWDGF